ncbi:MarR family winged helix-turn-helix transcriptional regulator [Paraburkholderia diazotrophica]|uniref:DNA-binding transcriptional regulator, MarR family n=1 Tax=Paraburkholderia diazotrophica TaxID=667676 RepID=A0A1H6SFM8_9BURK|nr:MarR family winged helix-turn-helix transcriptional regulator [Paraburkholderia diazotrophica]SEI66743.1 DNA-binding transcriptional regulator, MarR family [Paraburkholderia diazotrophica]
MSHDPKDDFRLTQDVICAISKARNVVMTQMDAAVKDLNIRAHHVGILLSLMRGIDTTPAMLSRHLGIDTGLMTRMLDKLEALRMLTRSRSIDDRRVVNLELTDAGREVALRIAGIAPEVLNARLGRFTTAEFEELRRLLRKFLDD